MRSALTAALVAAALTLPGQGDVVVSPSRADPTPIGGSPAPGPLPTEALLPPPPPGDGPGAVPETPRSYFERVVEERTPWVPPDASETLIEERTGAGPVVRAYTRGFRAEESEAYRQELRSLALGQEWPWYEERIRALGFTIVDAGWGARGRPKLALEKNGLRLVLEAVFDSFGRVVEIHSDPNL
jgi:hypothetical protein